MANEKRLIDANQLKRRLERFEEFMVEFGNVEAAKATRAIIKGLKIMPTVDAVEVVHGRWEKAEYHGFLRCSECKDVYIDDTWVADGKWNYCPNCGAKMDGDGNG